MSFDGRKDTLSDDVGTPDSVRSFDRRKDTFSGDVADWGVDIEGVNAYNYVDVTVVMIPNCRWVMTAQRGRRSYR